jgi:hypothetical protein
VVSKHRAQVIYTRNTKGGDAPAAGKYAWAGPTNCTFGKIILLNKKIHNTGVRAHLKCIEQITKILRCYILLRVTKGN